MAIYEFQTDDGEVIEVIMSFAEHDKRVKNDVIKLDDGRKAKKVWSRASSKNHRAIATCPGNWPQVSYAAGVHPDQVPQQVEHLRKMGLGFIEHTADGDPVFQDRNQRKRVCEALGLYDRSGGYSDPQAKHVTRIKSYR